MFRCCTVDDDVSEYGTVFEGGSSLADARMYVAPNVLEIYTLFDLQEGWRERLACDNNTTLRVACPCMSLALEHAHANADKFLHPLAPLYRHTRAALVP
jgi:hypothetical protein